MIFRSPRDDANDLWYRLGQLHRRCGVTMAREGFAEPKLWRVTIGEHDPVISEAVTLIQALQLAVLEAEQKGWPDRYPDDSLPGV